MIFSKYRYWYEIVEKILIRKISENIDKIENIDIDQGILQNIDIDKILHR